jgi:hypothetical protein
MVGVIGFEPTTSCSQSKRTTGLCYTPPAYARYSTRTGVRSQCGYSGFGVLCSVFSETKRLKGIFNRLY